MQLRGQAFLRPNPLQLADACLSLLQWGDDDSLSSFVSQTYVLCLVFVRECHVHTCMCKYMRSRLVVFDVVSTKNTYF